ncbi:MAG TPA: ester cyclase [Caulobacteraceae bacterium]
MSADANRILFQRFLQFINSASRELAEELVSPDAVFHAPGAPGPLRGPEGYLQLLAMLRGGFPDVQWTLDELVAEGDRLAARFTMRGTHNGPFLGLAPSGKPFVASSMAFYRLADGKIVEETGLPDMLAILQQIGAVPSP